VIDTLKISKQLEAAALTKAQAEAIAEALADVTTAGLATKSDVIELRSILKADIKDLELRLSAKIIDLKDQLTGRIYMILWGVIGAGAITWILQIFGTAIRNAFGQA
jgi:hypothetical protein